MLLLTRGILLVFFCNFATCMPTTALASSLQIDPLIDANNTWFEQTLVPLLPAVRAFSTLRMVPSIPRIIPETSRHAVLFGGLCGIDRSIIGQSFWKTSNPSYFSDELWIYDFNVMTWRPMYASQSCYSNTSAFATDPTFPLPTPRAAHVAEFVIAPNGSAVMAVHGGLSSGYNALNDTYFFLFENSNFQSAIALDPSYPSPPARWGHASIVFNNTMIICGGFGEHGNGLPMDVWRLQWVGGQLLWDRLLSVRIGTVSVVQGAPDWPVETSSSSNASHGGKINNNVNGTIVSAPGPRAFFYFSLKGVGSAIVCGGWANDSSLNQPYSDTWELLLPGAANYSSHSPQLSNAPFGDSVTWTLLPVPSPSFAGGHALSITLGDEVYIPVILWGSSSSSKSVFNSYAYIDEASQPYIFINGSWLSMNLSLRGYENPSYLVGIPTVYIEDSGLIYMTGGYSILDGELTDNSYSVICIPFQPIFTSAAADTGESQCTSLSLSLYIYIFH